MYVYISFYGCVHVEMEELFFGVYTDMLYSTHIHIHICLHTVDGTSVTGTRMCLYMCTCMNDRDIFEHEMTQGRFVQTEHP